VIDGYDSPSGSSAVGVGWSGVGDGAWSGGGLVGVSDVPGAIEPCSLTAAPLDD
jgi:hypothetical protein